MITFFNSKAGGLFFAAIAAITYGMNPLFALPLYQLGFDADSVLFLRYLPAALVLGVLTRARGQDLRLSVRELLGTAVGGWLFASSSLFLFFSYLQMPAGVASTLLFIYPVLVALIMGIGFKERISLYAWACIVLACAGVGLLCRAPDGSFLQWRGVVLVFLSALAYAIYLVMVNRSKLQQMPAEKMTFYVVLFGLLLYLIRLRFGWDLQGQFTARAWLNIAGISLLSSATSMICTTLALHRVGATPTAIFGALEPLTAVFFGVTVFHEHFSWAIGIGMTLILGAVILIARRRN